MPANMRVYVVFKDDHELHRNVMHWFCAYLKRDLGLDVRVHIWQPAEVALNQITYMKRNMQLAEKVGVCSVRLWFQRCVPRLATGRNLRS